MTDTVQQQTGAETVLWDLRDLYASNTDPAIESDLIMADSEAERFGKTYRGKVATLKAGELADAMRHLGEIRERMGKAESFANLVWTTNVGDAALGALLQRVREANARIQQKLLFFELEWINGGADRAALLDDPALAPYRHWLEHRLAYRPYVLSEPEEKVLTEKSTTGRSAWVRFYGQTVDTVTYPWEGKQVPQSMVLRQLYGEDRDTRRRAADSVTSGLATILKPATYVFNTLLADKASDDRMRGYPTWITSRNLSNEASDASVDALVQAVVGRYDIVARYYRLKKKLLGYDELFDYDRYAPLNADSTRYTWDEAKAMVLDSFGAFHPRMAEVAAEFFDRQWIHAPVTEGKRGGAYASPVVPSAHPYIFVNFTGMSRDVMTLAHELGHGIHMYLSRPRGYFGAYTPLTTAEMASVFGEMLVFSALIERETDPRRRLAMLAGKIEDTFATVFRQVSMNRFEQAIHTQRRTQGELTTQQYSDQWMESQRAMFGDSVTLRPDYSTWWSYIAHFIHTPGYVYAYAFGELLVLALFNKYRHEGAGFVPKYLDVLGAGGSDAPERILGRVGVDLTDPGFWQEGLQAVEDLVAQAEALA